MTEREITAADEDALVASTSLSGVIKGIWLGAALAVAVCAVTYSFAYPPYLSVSAAAFAMIASVIVVVRDASRREGTWGALLASAMGAGTLPALVTVSLFAATRPLIRLLCTNELHCYPKLGVILACGAGFTLVPLLLSTAVVVLVARRRRQRIARVIPIFGAVSLAIATIVTGFGAARALRYPTSESYIEGVPVVGRIEGATFSKTHAPPVSYGASTTALFDAQWEAGSFEDGRPCHLSLAHGGYDIPALTVAGDQLVCPNVRVRHDEARGIVIVESESMRGTFTPEFAVDTVHVGTSGPLYADGYELPNVAPSRMWIMGGVAGVLAAIALVVTRLRSERKVLADWRAAPIGKHTGDGWISFEDDGSPPLHLPSAAALPQGPVHVLGIRKGTKGDYRSTGAASSSSALASDLASIVSSSRDRQAATIAVFGLVALIAATPIGAALFVLTH